MDKNKFKRLMLFLVTCFITLIVISHYYFKFDLWSIIQGRSVLNSEKLTKLELNEISEIILITRSNVKKSTIIDQLKENGYTHIDQFGAARIFEKDNVKYVLSEEIVYKYFIRWKLSKS